MTSTGMRARGAALVAATLCAGCLVIGASPIRAQATTTLDVVGPIGSEAFGENVLVLSNGNYVVVDSLFDSPTHVDVGAVYLYNGATNQLISRVTGSTAGDFVGAGGLTEVGTSDFVIVSSSWDNGSALDAGAATWVDGVTGLDGVVTGPNSLVGATTNDLVGSGGVTALSNGNYVVASPAWDDIVGPTADVGAVTWGNGATGTSGAVTDLNSLVGTTLTDNVGSGGVTALTNGNYVVASPGWDDNIVPTINVGAVTLGDGATGATVGAVTDSNSLIGTTDSDQVGVGGVTALTNDNYIVDSPFWANGAVPRAGAVTWGDGTAGSTVGAVTAGNSLVGTTLNDNVGLSSALGIGGVTALTNGNYVVVSAAWDSAAAVPDVGAVTLGNGTGTTVGPVAATNSLVGTTDGDLVGIGGVTALTAGNFVVNSPLWNNGAELAAGAVTWVGAAGLIDVVTAVNSLVGTTSADRVGGGTDGFGNLGVTALTDGDYVVASPLWDNAAAVTSDVGAATLGDGTAGTTVGAVTDTNSLVGTADGDQVGVGGITALTNGNYVVDSPSWANGVGQFAGAVTWGDGTAGTTVGAVTPGNSLVGSIENRVGVGGVTALTNGNYVVASPGWDNAAAIADVGAVTLGNGTTGTSGAVTATNSLVGAADGDLVGNGGVTALTGGSYVVLSPSWDKGAIVDAGAATFGPAVGVSGPITATNSALGTPPGLIVSASERFTTDDAIVIGTGQNRVLLLRAGVQSPTFAATPGNVTVNAATGATNAAVNFTVPAATAKVGAPSVVCTPPSGTLFPIGTTAVTCIATDSAGFTATTSFAVTVNATPAPATGFVPLTPARLADTRPGELTVDTQFAGDGVRSRGSTLELVVAGRAGVALDAAAVALNVTAASPLGDGFVTVFPCGASQPTASSVNYTTGAVVPNAVVTKVGSGGLVCLFVSEATHLVVDVTGFFPASTTLQSINPARVLETRPGLLTIDGSQQGDRLRAASSTTAVQITGRASVPSGATAVVLNVTVTEAQGAGFVTAFPCGAPIPTASNINYVAGSTVAGLVVAKIGDGGAVCLFTSTATHLIADVDGYFPAITSYQALNPARLLETRAAESTIDGQFLGAGLLPAGTVTELAVTGRGGVPVGATTVVLNVTVTEPTAPGFITVYPCGITRPLTSNLNYEVGTTTANAAIVQVGTAGTVCLFNSNPTQLVADVSGYLAN